MKTSTSALNPFAVAYVPLARRESQNEDSTTPGEAAVSDTQRAADDLKLKGQQAGPVSGASPEVHDEFDGKCMAEECEMDLAYLQMLFPGVSDQSLVDVYNVNGGDVDAAVDMLTDLESADNCSAPLDNEGSSQKPVSSGECSSVKAVNVAGETSTSSGSSDLAVPNS